ncbi:squalene/phytoene synthase family protein [Pseudomonadota bacterium]
MNVPVEGQHNDRLFCWEQVNKTYPAFRISQVFVSREVASSLLPLYAFFSIVEQICGGSSDEELARSKLAWWRMECSPEKLAGSRHPVLQELRRTEAFRPMGPELITRLLYVAESRFEAHPPGDISELYDRCEKWARLQLEMEIAASGILPGVFEVPAELLKRIGMLQLLKESAGKKEQGAFKWIPLKSLARHGVSRSDFVDEPESEGVLALLNDLVNHGQLLSPHAAAIVDGKADLSGMRNFFAINGLHASKLRNLKTLSLDSYASEVSRIRFSDLLTAWASARRFEC